MIPLRLLLVDDDPSVRRALGGTLSEEGYEVATAEDAEKALARLTADELESRYARYHSDLSLLAENLETLGLFQAHYGDGEGDWEAAFSAADPYLRQIWDQYRVSYRWIEFRDTTNVVVYALGEPRSEQVFAGELSTPELQQEFRFSRSVPNPHGPASLGDVVAVAPLDQLLPPDALAQAFGRSGYTVVLDLLGNRVLAHPRRSLLQATASRLLGPEGWQIDSERLEPNSGSFEFHLADSARVASFITLETPAWTILTTTAVDEFSGPFTRTRRLFLGISGTLGKSRAVALCRATALDRPTAVGIPLPYDRLQNLAENLQPRARSRRFSPRLAKSPVR